MTRVILQIPYVAGCTPLLTLTLMPTFNSLLPASITNSDDAGPIIPIIKAVATILKEDNAGRWSAKDGEEDGVIVEALGFLRQLLARFGVDISPPPPPSALVRPGYPPKQISRNNKIVKLMEKGMEVMDVCFVSGIIRSSSYLKLMVSCLSTEKDAPHITNEIIEVGEVDVYAVGKSQLWFIYVPEYT